MCHQFLVACQPISVIVSLTSEAPAIWETIMWKRDEADAAAASRQSPPPLPATTSARQSPTPSPIARDAADKLVMNLGKSVMIKGELSGSEDLTLYGRMEG